MKVVLLTDVPPSRNFTAGIVLDQLCSFLPQGSLACFAVVEKSLDPIIPPELSWMPYQRRDKPRESWWRLPGHLGALTSLVMETYTHQVDVARLAREAIAFGKDFGAEAVWCVLQGQTMIRLARPVAQGLGVPLLTQVWDPPGWWLRARKVDRFSSAGVLDEFGRALRASTRCGTASWAMAEAYQHDYGVCTVPFLPSLDARLALEPGVRLRSDHEIIIGMAGQLYADTEWNALLNALDVLGWKLCGRDVRVRLLGRWAGIGASGKMHVEFLGWRPQDETVSLMAEADILFCPYWFDPAFETEARLSFPSKLTTYLAAGRPVLFFGPPYASPARFLNEHEAGLCCTALDRDTLIAHLERLVTDTELYTRLANNGRQAFDQFFGLKALNRSFLEFIREGTP